MNVVKHFVTENPSSYDEYSKIFNILKPDPQGVIKRYDSLSKNQYRNYFTEENECLISGDGIRFVVCSQWTINNIQPVIRFAKSRGYNVIEYKQ